METESRIRLLSIVCLGYGSYIIKLDEQGCWVEGAESVLDWRCRKRAGLKRPKACWVEDAESVLD